MKGLVTLLIISTLSLIVIELPEVKAADNCRPQGSCDSELADISKDKRGCLGLEKLKSCFKNYCTAVDYSKADNDCNVTNWVTIKSDFNNIVINDCASTPAATTAGGNLNTGTTLSTPTSPTTTTTTETTTTTTETTTTTATTTTPQNNGRKKRAADPCDTLRANVTSVTSASSFLIAFSNYYECIQANCTNKLGLFDKLKSDTGYVKEESKPECKTCGASTAYLAGILMVLMSLRPFFG
nr:hypothetical protein BgiMline_026264 [Biomphalaria glabrata]